MDANEYDVWYHVGAWTGWLFTWVLGVVVVGGTFVLIVVGLLMMSGCGGEGGDVNAAKGTTLATNAPPGTAVICDFGDSNTFSFVVGDNSSLDFCTLGGGVVKPDQSTVNEPTNSNNKTTTNVVATPTPGVI